MAQLTLPVSASPSDEARLLGDAARRTGAAYVEVHDSLGSTQDRARVLAGEAAGADAAAAPLPALVIARAQTAGRGRGGRAWASPAGGLWLSAVLRGATRPPLLPLTVPAALAAAHAVEATAPGLRVLLKWPNDLYAAASRRKLGGVLCDLEGGLAVLGIGLDVAVPAEVFPCDLGARATSILVELGAAPPLERVLGALCERLFPACAAWAASDEGARAASIDEAWARSLLRGAPPFRVEPPVGEPYFARAAGLDPDGALRVARVDDGRVERLLSAHLELG